MANDVIIYTDGASSGNPGPGGFGVVMISGMHRLEKSEGFRLTTNNRMELLAVIAGLEALKKEGCNVLIYTDSKYVADAVEKGWVFRWESKGFKKKKNPDLWIRFLKIYRKHNVRFSWIKGHNSDPENELCDSLAVEASRKNNLSEDTGFQHEADENRMF
jgi:ribonuclease HI